MKKENFFKIIILFLDFILFVGLILFAFFYITESQKKKQENEIENSFIGTNTDEENYIYDEVLKTNILKPNIEVTSARKINEEIVYDVKYKTDSNSFRFTPGNVNNTTYIFLGCSYVFGEGVNDNETLPYYFSKKLNFDYNVINAGFRATGTDFAYTLLKSNKFNDFMNKKIDYIIYGFFDDHIYRNLSGIFQIKDNKLIETEQKRIARMVEFSPTLKKYYKNDAIKLTVKLIQEMKILAQQKYKSRFLVFLYDPQQEITQKIKQYLDELDIENLCSEIDYSSKPEGYYAIKNECHPTSNANMENADTIYRYIFGND